MRRSVIATALLIVGFCFASIDVSASETRDNKSETELIRESLVASGMEPGSEQLEAGSLAIRRALKAVVWRVGKGKPSYRRAYKLHRVLHRRYLRTYNIGVDDLSRVATDGTFNCLSGVLFTGLAARRLGFETRVIEVPGHLLLELDVRGGPVLVETTSRLGFDVQPSRPVSYGNTRSYGRAWLVMPPENSWPVPLDAAIGFAWLNRAWRTFEAGGTVEAVRFVERAAAHVPGLAERVEAAPRLLARAFAREYEVGRFDTAYRIAKLEESLNPGRVSAQDRLLAGAQKRIEQLCAADRPADAAHVRAELDDFDFEPVAFALFDRTVAAVIVSAAVRVEDWALAESFVDRYVASEPDPVEAERFRIWVESRRANANPTCPPRPIAMWDRP